ncbi:MAG: response regulator transcription factor [Oscillospiraceae bacterium]|jgi:DNA-binding response OmpR family regulator|nr:response regulator transcription factor [Oscillospiraceae bacterium]
MRILLVEDDLDLCEAMRVHLTREGCEVDCCHDGENASRWLTQQAHSLVILDRMLPGLDGVSVLKRLRDTGSGVPVLMVTALDGIGDRVSGLDAGADDYLVKPFAVEELLARVRSLGRRPVLWGADPGVTYGDLVLDSTRHRLGSAGKSLALSKREAQLLEILMKSPGTVLPRPVLFARVWGPDAPVEEANLDNYVHFLRKRLTELGSEVRIKTVRSVGYTLC